MLLSDKFRPEFIESEYRPERLVISYFMYTEREQYDQRIAGRSGGTGEVTAVGQEHLVI